MKTTSGSAAQNGSIAQRVFAVLALMLCFALPARASIAVLVEEPYDRMSGMNPTGHTAVYLDHVCAASPTHLRPCAPGEMGVVISRYNNVNGYDWLATPLIPYLYAVESADQVPESADRETVARLREAYRRAHLMQIAPDDEEGNAPTNNWYELVGSAYDRALYGFQFKSTPEQDAYLMALFNDRKNKERYNWAFRNCADFARVTVNRLYPYAIKRNFVADLGITTPKQVGHAMSHYGKHHPETEFTTFRVLQVPGTLPRSHKVKGITECLFTCKRYVVPITVIQPVFTGILALAYMGKGHFEMPQDAPLLSLMPGANLSVSLEGAQESELPSPTERTGLFVGDAPMEER